MRGNPIKSNGTDVGHFGWEPCGLTIVSKDGSKVLQCRADTNNEFDLTATLSRDLAWDDNKRSWRWHKTWRVPDCLVTADPASLNGATDLEAHLSVVCQAELPHQLEDASIQSLDRAHPYASLQLVDGRCRFSRLRLVATTSTFGGRLFHFVVSIVRRQGDQLTALASVISTAFAVYSRKNADKKRKTIDQEAMMTGRWSEGYSFVPFEPKELDRVFIKKATNSEGVLVEEEITNSWEGLLAYFQAPNIRFKIRHPLFLAIRFSNVLVILRDSLRFPLESQQALRSFICSCGFPLNCKRDPAVKIGHGEFLPPWLIAFRSASMKTCNPTVMHKLADLMKVVKGPALGFVPDDSLLPERYSPTFDVASLGQLYTKLYAIEFAGGCGGTEGDGDNTDPGDDLIAKKARTKMDPPDTEGLLGIHPCGTPIFHPLGGEGMKVNVNGSGNGNHFANGHHLGNGHETRGSGTNISGSGSKTEAAEVADSSSSSSRGPSQLMRSSFESYFVALHGELRMLLQKVLELVSQCVTQQDLSSVDNLRRAYKDFTEALSVHKYVEENVLFKKLAVRVPRVTESYAVDHEMERGRLNEIGNFMSDMEPRKITELFLKISELAAVHRTHMEKEEVHLLPYFLDNFDDSEISDLIKQCQTTISEQVHMQQQKAAEKISLQNPRHQNAIERALRAASSEGEGEGDVIEEAPLEVHGTDVFGPEGDDVIALLDNMYDPTRV